MSRSLRRHHLARAKAKRRYHWGRDLTEQPKHLGIAARTPKNCSCWICGNQRQHMGATIQEQKADTVREQIKCLAS